MARIQEMNLTGGSRALLFIALAAGLVAAVIVFVVVSEGGGDDSSAPALSAGQPALVATQSINAGTEITAEMVRVVDVPEDFLVSGVFTDSDVVIGEVSKVTIAQGEQITSGKIGLPVPDNGLPGVVPAGMRGVAVSVDEVTAVGGNLLPGDRVDIIATTRINRAPGLNLAEDEYMLRTATVLQNIEVLSVAQEAQKPSAQSSADSDTGVGSSTSGQIPDDVEDQPDARTITLALTPEQAQSVISSQEYAVRVWAVVRAFGDVTIHDIAPQEQIIVED